MSAAPTTGVSLFNPNMNKTSSLIQFNTDYHIK